jgi:hypothetical protein
VSHHPTPRLLLAALLCALAVLAAPAAANAAFGLTNVTAAPDTTQAGGHPGFRVHFDVTDPGRDLRNLTLHLPPGLLGNPSVAARCSQAAFAADACDAASTRVGTTTANVTAFLVPGIGTPMTATGDVFNLVPPAGEPARLGIVLRPVGGLLGKIFLQSPVSVRDTTDFGLDSAIRDIPNVFGGLQLDVISLDLTLDATANGAPFLTNPTSCRPATTTIVATSYAGDSATASSTFTPTGCDAVPFTPSLAVAPTTQRADQPGVLSTTISVPGAETPERQSHVRRAEVTLPVGTAFSPGLANHVKACADAEFAKGSDAAVTCPAASQIGDVSFATPLLGTLAGKVFLGAPTPAQKLRLFVLADDPRLRVKLTGDVFADAATGQVRAVFDNLPQVPFTAFTLTFGGGAEGVLKAPATCGRFSATARLTPYSGGADVAATGSFATVGCPAPAFAPTLTASVGNPTAGAFTTLRLRVTRPDGQLPLQAMRLSMPPGLAGRLGAVPACAAATAAAGSCPTASRVGHVSVAAGTGPAPLTLGGSVYLTGPIGGSLAGLAIVVPAVVGPLNFGDVVSLARLDVRPDAGIDVTTGRLPQIVGGIPLSYRALDLALDRPGFLVNATSCARAAIAATFSGPGATHASASAPYQPAGCASQPFAPKLSATLGAPGDTAKGARPPLTTVLTQRQGEANPRHVEVTLPVGVAADAAVLNRACPEAQLNAGACPASAVVGSVRADTPLLLAPLHGPVTLIRPAGGVLPELALALRGPISLNLRATVGFGDQGRLKTIVDGIPDVPISRLTLSFNGGAGGVLSAARNLCAAPTPVVDASFVSHGGAARAVKVPATVPCGASAS